MRYKLLAVDVDGTLLRRDGSIHPADIGAVARLRAEGVPVTIVTGRLYSGTRAIACSLGLCGPIACVDGSHIVDLGDGRALYVRVIAGEDATVLRDILHRHRIASFLFAQDTIIHGPDGEPYIEYVRSWSPNLDFVARVSEHPFWEHELGLMAVVGIGEEPEVLAAADALRSQLDQAAVVVTFPVMRARLFAILVRAAGPTKGTALAWLADYHRCTPEEVVAVGDWINDVPMFQVAGRSFAMGQAPAGVKAMATDELVADSQGGGGIAEAILRAWGL